MSRVYESGRALAVMIAGILFLSASVAVGPGAPEGALTARTLQVGDPVAVISGLPVVVSNGTWAMLNGSGSSDPDGILVNYTWEITISTGSGDVIFLYAQEELFKFREAGYYTVKLTVRDDDGNTSAAVAYVWSFADIDFDSLPDWWEEYYFQSLSQNATMDPDNDGYSNMEEFGSGTNPTVKDPPPGLVTILKENWMYLAVIIAALILVAILLLWLLSKRRKREDKKMVEAAIEIERELEFEK